MERNNNPWNHNNGRASNSFRQLNNSAEAKFKEAHERLQQSVKKHLGNEYESSEEEEDLETQPILESVLKNYSQFGGTAEDLERTQNYLENTFQSGAAVCLICIGSIKRAESIWNCESCYGFFHLNCIQRWGKDSIALSKLLLEDRPEKSVSILWQCPKCRKDYDPKDIPYKYECFCGQTVDPPFHPWLVPHSCGETCNRLLKPDCGHKCLLLCHPGPCPPCPKVIKTNCYCGKGGLKNVRCSHREWSCQGICDMLLACGRHKCLNKCHSGVCPSCAVTVSLPCQCGKEKASIKCGLESWQCNAICEKILSCGLHKCLHVCHKSDDCGSCPGTEARTCPCGKTTSVLPCDQPIPTCGSTCNKVLNCGLHLCPQRCHRDLCGGCLEFIEKSCRCGLHKKEIACHKEFLCETKCKKMRDCGHHPCNKKCCDGNCPPCEKRCGKTLSCGQHKCNSICHRGACYPCNVTKKISCRCGYASMQVPCCKKKPRPPKCSKLCQIPPNCHHKKREPHRCHFNSCPECKQVCNKPLTCGHTCKLACHAAVLVYSQPDAKPATPWEAATMPVEMKSLPCPPCYELVTIECLGRHEAIQVPCVEAAVRSCGRPCGTLLACTNHTCSLPCHLITQDPSECEDCSRECEAERNCEHPCKKGCHPPPCPTCNVNLKLTCHCHVSFVFVPCNKWLISDETAREEMLSCQNQCPLSYNCGHRCPKKCHKGDCQGTDICKKKVKVTCPCKRIKKEIQCSIVTSGAAVIQCDEICQNILMKKKEEEQSKQEAARLAKEKKDQEELEMFEKKMLGKKRSRKKVKVEEENISYSRKKIFTVCFVLGSIVSAVLYVYLSY